MSFLNWLNASKKIIEKKTYSAELSNLLVRKGNELHLIILFIVSIFGVLYSTINIFYAYYLLAILSLLLVPITFIAFLSFVRISHNFSKLFNLIGVVTVISLQHLMQDHKTFVLVFFIPIILCTLVVFQGKSRKIGYWASLATFAILVILLTVNFELPLKETLNPAGVDSEIFLNLSGSALVSGIILIFQLKISDAMQEKTLHQNKEIASVNQHLTDTLATKDKMLSLISHDVRNPLILISSAMRMIDSGYEGKENGISNNKELIAELTKRSENTVLLLDNMIFWAKQQTHAIHFDPQIISTKAIAEMIKNDTPVNIAYKRIRFDIQNTTDCKVYADKNMVESILRNLLSNAIKFTPEGGTIEVKLTDADNHVEISVGNSGKGLSEEEINKLTENISFSKKGTKNEKGHGIGLYLISEFISMHGSTLQIASKQGEMTVFSFRLSKNKMN
jgi:signal transduction histidine kinase